MGGHQRSSEYMTGGVSTQMERKLSVKGRPDGRPKDCIAGTGLSKNTVYKWWDNPPTVRYEDGGLTVKIRPSQALSDLIQEDLRKGL